LLGWEAMRVAVLGALIFDIQGKGLATRKSPSKLGPGRNGVR